MSGGHYDYKHWKLSDLADDIEREFINDGKYIGENWQTGEQEEMDRIEDASDEQRPIILKEVKSLIDDLRKCAIRAKELEWYMSGDTGADSYLERLKEKNVL